MEEANCSVCLEIINFGKDTTFVGIESYEEGDLSRSFGEDVRPNIAGLHDVIDNRFDLCESVVQPMGCTNNCTQSC
jgi:hypothetical protein